MRCYPGRKRERRGRAAGEEGAAADSGAVAAWVALPAYVAFVAWAGGAGLAGIEPADENPFLPWSEACTISGVSSLVMDIHACFWNKSVSYPSY